MLRNLNSLLFFCFAKVAKNVTLQQKMQKKLRKRFRKIINTTICRLIFSPQRNIEKVQEKRLFFIVLLIITFVLNISLCQ